MTFGSRIAGLFLEMRRTGKDHSTPLPSLKQRMEDAKELSLLLKASFLAAYAYYYAELFHRTDDTSAVARVDCDSGISVQYEIDPNDAQPGAQSQTREPAQPRRPMHGEEEEDENEEAQPLKATVQTIDLGTGYKTWSTVPWSEVTLTRHRDLELYRCAAFLRENRGYGKLLFGSYDGLLFRSVSLAKDNDEPLPLLVDQLETARRLREFMKQLESVKHQNYSAELFRDRDSAEAVIHVDRNSLRVGSLCRNSGE